MSRMKRRKRYCAGCEERIWFGSFIWEPRVRHLHFHERCKAAFIEGIYEADARRHRELGDPVRDEGMARGEWKKYEEDYS